MLQEAHKSPLFLLRVQVDDTILGLSRRKVELVGTERRSMQIRSKQIHLRLSTLDGQLVVRHLRQADCVTDILLEDFEAIAEVLRTKDRTL